MVSVWWIVNSIRPYSGAYDASVTVTLMTILTREAEREQKDRNEQKDNDGDVACVQPYFF